MSNSIISPNASNGNPPNPDALQLADPDTYLEIAGLTWRTSEMILSETANPHHTATHTPTGWQFFVEGPAPLAFAISPAGDMHLVDGAPAQCIIELLTPTTTNCIDCGAGIDPDHAPHIPACGYVCYDCLTYYADPVIEVAQ